ncbi:MAG: putative rane protein [Anaerocolumna sp.]|jgi:stage II sporulation protein M|nr:putative rane protein [Anaerocolumna sp.]
MQYRKNRVIKLGEVKIILIILGIGLLLGIVFSRILKDSYWNQMEVLDVNYFHKIKNATIEYSVLFRYVLWEIFSSYLIFWVFCCTSLGIHYIGITILYTGFKSGFFISVIFMRYGLKGILLILGYTLPQYLIYIPVAYLCLRSGFMLCNSLYHEGKLSTKGKVERVIKHTIIILILGGALFMGGLFETYAGTFLLRKVLLLF